LHQYSQNEIEITDQKYPKWLIYNWKDFWLEGTRYAWRRPFGGGGAAFVRSANRMRRSNEPPSDFESTTESYSEKWSSMGLNISTLKMFTQNEKFRMSKFRKSLEIMKNF